VCTTEAFETLPQYLCDSLNRNNCCANCNALTYLLTVTGYVWQNRWCKIFQFPSIIKTQRTLPGLGKTRRTCCYYTFYWRWKSQRNSVLKCRSEHQLLPALWLRTHTHTYKFLSGCKEVEHCTSQLSWPHNFPQPRNTTLLHELYLATTQILAYTTTQRLPTLLPLGLVC